MDIIIDKSYIKNFKLDIKLFNYLVNKIKKYVIRTDKSAN